MNCWFLFALIGAIFCCFCCSAVIKGKMDNNVRRLPGDLKPIFYKLRIHPFFDAPGATFDPSRNQTFDGVVSIIATAVKPTSTILLNAVNLTFPCFEDIIVYSITDQKSIKMVNFSIIPKNQTISIEVERELRPNEIVEITLQYIGKINDIRQKGFFKSSNTDEYSGKYETVYVTHFETSGARLMFPCFDEPDYKAIFEVTVVKPKAWIALSNAMNISTVEIGNGYEEAKFESTPIMSTYLLAIGIGDLISIQGYTADRILTRIWSFRSGEGKMKAALESAIRCTDAMTKYTNYSLPLKKIDHLTVPNFNLAMENFGLIVYGEFYLLYNFNETTSENALSEWMKHSSIICHELSHHWFGDMVTNKWWGDVFIHEGFADFFENKAMALAYPQEKVVMDFEFAKTTSTILNPDIFPPTHPIITENGSFDYVTYQIGGAVIRQLEAVISPKILQKGLQKYIKKYQFSNANYQQLLDEIQNAVDGSNLKDWCAEPFNVTKFMDPWLNQIGYPSLSIAYFNGTFEITQNDPNGTHEKLWPLPIFVQLDNNQERLYWSASNYVCKNKKTLPKTSQIKTSVAFINRDFLGVTNTIYSSEALEAIADALTSFTTNFQLPPASLYTFVNDVTNSAQIPKAHLKNMIENVLMHQRNAFTLGIFKEFTDEIEAWLEEGRFNNAIARAAKWP